MRQIQLEMLLKIPLFISHDFYIFLIIQFTNSQQNKEKMIMPYLDSSY
jgi:hypothetical protein